MTTSEGLTASCAEKHNWYELAFHRRKGLMYEHGPFYTGLVGPVDEVLARTR